MCMRLNSATFRVGSRHSSWLTLGMSDLLSPIYYVADANEADAFWGLCGVMRMMVRASLK